MERGETGLNTVLDLKVSGKVSSTSVLEALWDAVGVAITMLFNFCSTPASNESTFESTFLSVLGN